MIRANETYSIIYMINSISYQHSYRVLVGLVRWDISVIYIQCISVWLGNGSFDLRATSAVCVVFFFWALIIQWWKEHLIHSKWVYACMRGATNFTPFLRLSCAHIHTSSLSRQMWWTVNRCEQNIVNVFVLATHPATSHTIYFDFDFWNWKNTKMSERKVLNVSKRDIRCCQRINRQTKKKCSNWLLIVSSRSCRNTIRPISIRRKSRVWN